MQSDNLTWMGKYTVFAEVISGMETIHHMEVGGQILRASVIID